jgi:hypothetical protein
MDAVSRPVRAGLRAGRGNRSDNRTGRQGNLYADTDDPYSFHFSVENAVKPYLDAGLNPRKLTSGLAYYDRGWQNVTDGGKGGEWQAAKGAAPGQFQEEAGTRSQGRRRCPACDADPCSTPGVRSMLGLRGSSPVRGFRGWSASCPAGRSCSRSPSRPR